MSTRDLSLLEERLGYKFKNIKFLETGVTHSSFSNETKNHVPYNERQEFLGDAVLSIIVSDYIFENYTKLPEGELTKLRASLVCENFAALQTSSNSVLSFALATVKSLWAAAKDLPSLRMLSKLCSPQFILTVELNPQPKLCSDLLKNLLNTLKTLLSRIIKPFFRK